MDAAQFQVASHAAIQQIVEYYATLQDRRAMSDVQPGYLRNLLPQSAPEEGEAWAAIQKDIEDKIMPGLTHWQSPNFMAFFPCNSSFPGILGELYSAAFNGVAFNWICSPAVTELETIVLDWMAKAWNLPPSYRSDSEGGGVIQGSASEAIVTVMVAARDRFLRDAVAKIVSDKEREDAFFSRRAKLVTLGSEMAHSSTQKAAQITGVRFRSIPVETADGFALKGSQLRSSLEECISEGLEPFYLTVTLGTTSTCAVDDFEEIASVLADYPSVWVHVDAAYAGAALICPEYHHHTKHFDKFNSFNANMHKWLLTNFDASCLYVKRRKDLTDALSINRSYYRNSMSDTGLVTDYRDWQIPLGRRFRALKIWFVTRSFGIRGLQEFIRNHVALSEEFASWMHSRSDLFCMVAGPTFALNVFYVRASPDSGPSSADDLSAENSLTEKVYDTINREGKIMLTSSVVLGRFVIRIVSATLKTERVYLERAFHIIVEVTERVMKM